MAALSTAIYAVFRRLVYAFTPQPLDSIPTIAYDLLPKRCDWRYKGVITHVRTQDNDMCWVYAGVGAVESIHKIRRGKLHILSECEVIKRNKWIWGWGGYTEVVFRDAMKYGLFPVDGSPAVKIDNFGYGERMDELGLFAILCKQPVCVGIAVGQDFETYTGGIYYGPFGKRVNHSMLAVGYNKDYIILKNSWGPLWGEKGYIRIARKVAEEAQLFYETMHPIIKK